MSLAADAPTADGIANTVVINAISSYAVFVVLPKDHKQSNVTSSRSASLSGLVVGPRDHISIVNIMGRENSNAPAAALAIAIQNRPESPLIIADLLHPLVWGRPDWTC